MADRQEHAERAVAQAFERIVGAVVAVPEMRFQHLDRDPVVGREGVHLVAGQQRDATGADARCHSVATASAPLLRSMCPFAKKPASSSGFLRWAVLGSNQ